MEKIKRKIIADLKTVIVGDEDIFMRALHIGKPNQENEFVLHLSILKQEKDIEQIYAKLNENMHEFMHIKKIMQEKVSIQIFLKKEIYAEILNYAHNKNENLGKFKFGQEKNILIEFSSPNIAKEFHAGHLRTTLLGGFLSNLYSNFGYSVGKINYLGDYGKQFGMILYALHKYNIDIYASHDIVKDAYEIYVRINADAKEDPEIHAKSKDYFMQLENGREDFQKIWQLIREKSIEKYKLMYKKLNIEFDLYSGESFYAKNKINFQDYACIKIDKDGSIFADLDNLGKLVIQRSNGSTLYSTRDLNFAKEKFELCNFEKNIYVVADQQSHYFKQLFKLFDLLDIDKDNRSEHISYGMVEGMSSRKGTVVFLDDIFSHARDIMQQCINKSKKNVSANAADELAKSALIIQDFSAKRTKGYKFDMERFCMTEGETGPYLQYTHCRLVSIMKKNIDLYEMADSPVKNLQGTKAGEYQLCMHNIKLNEIYAHNDIRKLIMQIMQFEIILHDSLKTAEPSKLVTYLMKLSRIINRLFEKLRVFGLSDENMRKERMLVFNVSRHVLANGMKILGMVPLESI